MNSYESIIKESLECIEVAPSEALRIRIMKGVVDGADTQRFYRQKSNIKTVALAAIVSVLVLTTAAAYGNVIVSAIKQIMFGDSIVTQIIPEHKLHLGSWGVMNRSELAGAKDYPLGLFNLLEEARHAAPFLIRVPEYLPKSVIGLRDVGVWRVEDPDSPWMHFVILNYDVPFEYNVNGIIGNGTSSLTLKQTYGGPGAYISVDTIYNIEKVMIGNSEAALIIDDGMTLNEDGEEVTILNGSSYTLWWMNDDFAFELVGSSDIFDLDTMIRIAESIR